MTDPTNPMDDSDRLKPCPFCGSEAEMLTVPEDHPDAGAVFAQCTHSACMASSALVYPLMDDVKPLLLERWNKRRPMLLSDKRIAELVVLLHRMFEAPTSQISVGWKNAIGPALLALKE